MAKAQNLQQAITNMLRNIENNEAFAGYGETLDFLLGYLNLDLQRQKAINGKWFECTESLMLVLDSMRAETKLIFGTLRQPKQDYALASALFKARSQELKTLLLDLQATFE